jgi:crotonobetainyl-CoA:carnitine CoA-transferase CaiB-like acyl-CoA transferase
MKPLQGLRVVAWGAMAGRPLARYLESLGATVTVAQPQLQSLSGVDFLIDDLGLACLQDLGLSRAQIEAQFPQLVHVSVTAFGSFGPRARWRGGELVASAMSGVLRLTGAPDRAPVKEARDACIFHADMAAAAVCG